MTSNSSQFFRRRHVEKKSTTTLPI